MMMMMMMMTAVCLAANLEGALPTCAYRDVLQSLFTIPIFSHTWIRGQIQVHPCWAAQDASRDIDTHTPSSTWVVFDIILVWCTGCLYEEPLFLTLFFCELLATEIFMTVFRNWIADTSNQNSIENDIKLSSGIALSYRKPAPMSRWASHEWFKRDYAVNSKLISMKVWHDVLEVCSKTVSSLLIFIFPDELSRIMSKNIPKFG